jgi:hypothetical protein
MNFPSIPYDEGMFGLDFQTYWNRSTEERLEPVQNDVPEKTDIAELRTLSLESWKSNSVETSEETSEESTNVASEEVEVVKTDFGQPKNTLVEEKSTAQTAWIVGLSVGAALLLILLVLATMKHRKKKLRS